MKKLILPAVIITVTSFFISCSKGITTYEAANGKAKCGRHLK